MGDLPESACICRYGIEEAFACAYPFYINCQVQFSLTNDIMIKGVFVKQIDFLFGDERWEIVLPSDEDGLKKSRHLAWDFCGGIGSGGYTLECSLCPPKGTWDKSRTDIFWKMLRDFIFYRSVGDHRHRYMVLNLHINVLYEYGAPEGAGGILHMEFDGDQEHSKGYLTEHSSSNGYFSFDTK